MWCPFGLPRFSVPLQPWPITQICTVCEETLSSCLSHGLLLCSYSCHPQGPGDTLVQHHFLTRSPSQHPVKCPPLAAFRQDWTPHPLLRRAPHAPLPLLESPTPFPAFPRLGTLLSLSSSAPHLRSFARVAHTYVRVRARVYV